MTGLDTSEARPVLRSALICGHSVVKPHRPDDYTTGVDPGASHGDPPVGALDP
jgi:hypothetical protein